MLKKQIPAVILIFAVLIITACSSFPFFKPAAKEGESEIIINIGNTVYNGKYNVFVNGDLIKSVKSKGGTVKHIIPNGQHVVMVVWQEPYGTSTDMTSININANSNRTILFVTKPANAEKMEIVIVGVTKLPKDYYRSE